MKDGCVMGWGEEIHSLTLVTPEIDTHLVILNTGKNPS